MIINKPHLCSKKVIHQPKYSGKWIDKYKEPVVLLSESFVTHASPKIIIEFDQSGDLNSGRWCITRSEAEKHELGSNGVIPCYVIPISHLDFWVSGAEVAEEANNLFKEKV